MPPSTSEVELPGHVSHVGPGTLLNVPTAQGKQGAPSAPVYPGLHWHMVAPAALCEFAGHARQVPPAGVLSDSILCSDNEAREKARSDRWWFQMYSLENCQSLG